MKWFDKWLAKSIKRGLEYSRQEEDSKDYVNRIEAKQMAIGGLAVERSRAEGEDRITFELTTAVGGRILNVRRYDQRKDYHDSQTYVIPSEEDVGERVAKILNLELLK